MYKKIEREIQIFAEGFGGIKRTEFVHGTLYVTFEDDRDCAVSYTHLTLPTTMLV